MVFKKPYGFLIKHFKLIHIIITVLMSYLIYKMTKLISFFNEYVSSGWLSLNENELASFINPLMYISIIVIIILCVIIYLLMNFKKKPRLYYLLTPIVYLVLLVVLIITNSNLKVAITDIMSPITVRALRDTQVIVIALQFLFIVFALLRAIGFSVKKFNFKKDIADLEISELDNEEVEVGFEVEKYKIKRNFKRRFRNFTYIFLEHKFIWMSILGVIVLSIVGVVLFKIISQGKIYSQGQAVPLDGYSIVVNNSYVTTRDFKDDELSDKYKLFIVETTIRNAVKDRTFKIDNMALAIDDKTYQFTTSNYSKLIDYGIGYNIGTKLSTEKPNNYIFVFKIPRDLNVGRAQLRYLYKTEYKDGVPKYSYRKIKLSYKNLENSKSVSAKLKEELSFGNNKIKINSYDISNTYNYKYDICESENNCKTNNGTISPSSNTKMTILKLDMDLNLNENDVTVNKDFGEYLESIATLKYTKNNKTYIQKNITNLTPDNIDGNEIYLNVTKEIEGASKIILEFKNRGIKYSYQLKG